MIDCPTNVTSNNYIEETFGLVSVRTDQESPNSTVTWNLPVTSDNSNGTVTVVSSPFESGDMIPIGTHTITFTATDPYGNNDTCEFYIKVEDVEPPNPTCPSIAYGVADPESPNGTVSFNITVVDNVLVATFYTNHTLVSSSAIDMVSYTFKSTGVFPIGETIIEYKFFDNASPTANQASCYVKVQITDKQAPYIIDCPMDMIVNTTTGEVFAINVTWVEPTATDNSGETPVPVADYTSGDNMFPIGSTTVQYNVSDSVGNFNDSCSFVIHVEDNESPMIDCPTNVTSNNYIGEAFGLVSVRTDQESPNSTVTWNLPVTSDNSNGTVTVVSSIYESGDMLPIGIHTITFTATDPYGNSDTCEFYIDVEDVEPPNPICPSIAYGVADPESPNGTVSFNITVVDNVLVTMFYTNYTLVSPNAIDMVSYTFTTTGVFPIGETIIKYKFNDNAIPTSNQASCYVKVQITDKQAPYIFDCLMDMIVNTTTGEVFAINVTWVEPTATDNSGETPVPVADYTSGDNMFPIGSTTVQYNVSDSVGNFNDSCSFVIHVEDNESPMIHCPTNVTSNNYIGEPFGLVIVRTDQESPISTVTWDPPVTSDNSNGTVTVVSSPFESGDMIPIGTHTITFTATDPYGNNDTCEFYIAVEDVDPPNPTCPSIAYGVADPESTNGTVSFNITVVDNVLVAIFSTNHTLVSPSTIDMVSYTFTSTGVFPIGETIIEYTFHDNASPISNQASCYVKVQIPDQEAPDIINCPMDMIVNTTVEAFAINVTWIEPTATDNSGETPVPVADYISGDNMFPIGDTTVQYNVSDSVGNYNESCSFVVNVEGGPCDTDLVLTEWQRSILYDLGSESPISDDFIIDGWYKLRNEGDRIDIRMPTSTPGSFKCGTLFPVWIDDTYPELGDPIKSVTGCIDVNGDPCAFTVPISLLACSTVNNDLYFVHYFVDTPGTLIGYCTGNESHTIL
ncbi:hyalin-like [Antedon mediterranea]|uniref:hyalin-like n=1 Tax=Antedon mediterranea TaxID=105859 RepID=UPI003AF5E8AA